MENKQKEVFFWEYCKTCEHCDTPEDQDPCNECLNEPSNENSHKPVYWRGKDENIQN